MSKIAAGLIVTLVTLTMLEGAAWASPVGRIPIPTLFDTGVDASGNPLSDGTIGDPHYQLSSVPFPSVSTTVVLRQQNGVSVYPIGPWAGNDNLSAWIAPDNANYRTVSALGEYYYTTTFDLSGFDVSTVQIFGAWAADDVGAAIILNGQQISVLTSLTYGLQNYGALTAFDYYYRDSQGALAMTANAPLQSGLVPGINTLSFRVDNEGGPTGLRVEFSATAVPTPEPSSLAVLAGGLMGMLALGRASSKRLLAKTKS